MTGAAALNWSDERRRWSQFYAERLAAQLRQAVVLLDGVPLVPECSPDRGVVFQRYSVLPHLTAVQNVMFGLECAGAPLLGKLFGAARRQAAAQAAEMLAAVGLADNLDIYPAQMSGGMQQRLAIAQGVSI